MHRQLLARCQPLDGQFTGTGMRRYEQRITEAARTTAGRWDGYARTGQTLDIGQEMRCFALDGIWRSLTGHPLDDGTEHEPAAVAAVATALPTLPADATDAQDAVAADLARIDAMAQGAEIIMLATSALMPVDAWVDARVQDGSAVPGGLRGTSSRITRVPGSSSR
ncbi:hypothetical protein [Streptomyces mirabilis]|uniref:hypothetical protein n=1 Tax=Streptomyces mirabilis TaxID=68239 RepID=UPI00224FACD9|nr:hypothetical protein [Streptomyces mirabilis]MCX4429593.1 cytochrome P450 [Streptomyces mirabilis]